MPNESRKSMTPTERQFGFLGNNSHSSFFLPRDPLKYEESFNKKDGRLRPCQQKQHGLHRAEIWEENWD